MAESSSCPASNIGIFFLVNQVTYTYSNQVRTDSLQFFLRLVQKSFKLGLLVGEVSIDVVDLDHNAVLQAGSLTLADVKAQQMLRRSKVI